MTDLDPDKIMAEHQPSNRAWGAFCRSCFIDMPLDTPWPCLPYRLAAAVIRWQKAWQGEDRSHAETQAENKALRAKVERSDHHIDQLIAENAALRAAGEQ